MFATNFNDHHGANYHHQQQLFQSSLYDEESESFYQQGGVIHTHRMIPIVFNNNNTSNMAGYEEFMQCPESSFIDHQVHTTSTTSSSSYSTTFDEYADISPEEQQRCPTMLIHLKCSKGTKRKILQDITWELYHYDGLMVRIAKLFPQGEQEQIQVSCSIGKSRKVAVHNDDDWQQALQQVLLNDETMIKVFIKSNCTRQQKQKKNLLEKIVRKHEKHQAGKHSREVALIDTSSIKTVYIDAGSILLHVRDLKSLAYSSEKDIAEKTLLRLAKSLHQTESFDQIHVLFNSTMNVQPEENEAGTFVVSIAEPFSTSGDLMMELLNRQIIAGALESCLVVSCDRVLSKDLNDTGVKICNARSWFKICQHFEELMMNNNTTKDWLRNIISEIEKDN